MKDGIHGSSTSGPKENAFGAGVSDPYGSSLIGCSRTAVLLVTMPMTGTATMGSGPNGEFKIDVRGSVFR